MAKSIIIKPSDRRILAKLKEQQKEDHNFNRYGKGMPGPICRAIVITALLQEGKIDKEIIRAKLARNPHLPYNTVYELDGVWEQVKAMII